LGGGRGKLQGGKKGEVMKISRGAVKGKKKRGLILTR